MAGKRIEKRPQEEGRLLVVVGVVAPYPSVPAGGVELRVLPAVGRVGAGVGPGAHHPSSGSLRPRNQCGKLPLRAAREAAAGALALALLGGVDRE